MSSLLASMKRCLENAGPLEPVPAGIEPDLKVIPGIRAVLFDIYGTMLVSASGDIDSADLSSEIAVECVLEAGVSLLSDEKKDAGREIISEFRGVVRDMHEQGFRNGIKYPEVDIILVWKTVMEKCAMRGIVTGGEHADMKQLAALFELRNNPVFPMPAMKQTIGFMKEAAMPLGIVSNAQFFTPLILNYFITGDMAETGIVSGFDHRIEIYSFEHGASKPDQRLFSLATTALKHMGIRAEETVFVGNDMLNDIYGAYQAGMKTILFAGDKRSLRMRSGLRETEGLKPDAVISRLDQIATVLERE